MWGTEYTLCVSDQNALVQYSCRNTFVLSGISDFFLDNTLKESVISILADIEVFVEHPDIEACHRFDKPNRQRSQLTIVQFINKKNAKQSFI